MIKIVALIKRRPDLTLEEFCEYYEYRHAPLFHRSIPADVAAANFDPAPRFNHACEPELVEGTTAQEAHLGVEVTGSADPVFVGQQLTLNAMGLSCAEPHGAFYAFPQIGSTGMNDETFAERLLMEERVAVIPGSAFGEGGSGHVRICYAQSYDLLVEAMERMRKFVERTRVSIK